MEKVLNKRLLDTLEPPDHGRMVIRDRLQPGLRVRVTPKGIKTFSCIYRWQGRQRRESLGKWPITTVKIARDRTKQILATVASGRDPRRKGADTVGDVAILFDQYCQHRIVAHQKMKRAIENHVLPKLGNLPIKALRRGDVHDILDDMVAQGKVGAAREVRKHLHRMLSWAANRDLIDANPLHNMERDDLAANKDAGRELTAEELKKIWSACLEMGYPWGDLYRLLILTGQRRSDWGDAVWDEVSDDTLTVAASRYKSRRDHIVPLSGPAKQIVDNLPRQAGDYLFSTKEGHVAVCAWSGAKKKLDAFSGVTGWRTHDLRVTVESRLAALKFSLEIRGAVLGHARQGLQRVYQKYDFSSEKRLALEAHAREVLG